MVLHNETRTAEVLKIEHNEGTTWEVRTYPKGANKAAQVLKSQFNVFNDPFDFIEFIAFNEYK